MSYRGSNNDNGFVVLGAIAAIIMVIFITPFISFWLCYFGGWIAKITIGAKLVEALNMLFNTTYFIPDKLPLMAGALGWIGSYFKSTKEKHKEK